MKPVVGILIDRPPTDAFVSVLAELRRWCRPLTAGNGTPEPVAWIASSPAAAAAVREPWAAWIESADEVDDGAAAFLTDNAALADAVGPKAIVAGGNIDTTKIPVVGPFVRARQRRAHAMPEQFIVEIDANGEARAGDREIPAHLIGSALCLASAAVVHGERLLGALARGAPCVTDADSAANVGVIDGVHVIVADGDALAAANALATDEIRAAQLSAAARDFVERHHDGAAAARRIAAALQVLPASPGDRLTYALDALGTPPTAAARERLLSLALVS